MEEIMGFFPLAAQPASGGGQVSLRCVRTAPRATKFVASDLYEAPEVIHII